jgi:hypothetical protein
MHKITKDRIKLIKTMMKVLGDFKEEGYPHFSHYVPVGERMMMNIIRNDEFHFFLSLSQEEDFRISYARRKEDRLNAAKRVKTTLGRFLVAKMGLESTPFISKFVERVWGELHKRSADITVIRGDELVEHYRYSPAGSCMTGPSAWKVSLYGANPEKVGLVIMGDLRALLWKTDEGATVMDRIYPSGHSKEQVLRRWGDENGFIHRVRTGLVDTDRVGLSDGKVYHVTLNAVEGSEELQDDFPSAPDEGHIFPYMDTFCFLSGTLPSSKRQSFKVTNASHIDSDDQSFLFRSTDGDPIPYSPCGNKECDGICTGGECNKCDDCDCDCGRCSCDECNPDGDSCDDHTCSNCWSEGCGDCGCRDCNPDGEKCEDHSCDCWEDGCNDHDCRHCTVEDCGDDECRECHPVQEELFPDIKPE